MAIPVTMEVGGSIAISVVVVVAKTPQPVTGNRYTVPLRRPLRRWSRYAAANGGHSGQKMRAIRSTSVASPLVRRSIAGSAASAAKRGCRCR